MTISGLFIRRPVMTTLSMLSILLFGIIAYTQLPVSDLPNVDRPVISVSAGVPGAGAETMASTVAAVLEKEFMSIPGVESITSSSGTASSNVTVEFSLDRNIDAAAQDIQSAIAHCKMPADMPSPPRYRKSNPAMSPIIYLVLTSASMPLSDLHEYGESVIGQRISMVNGVAQVQVKGGQKYAVRIELDPFAMASRGIGTDEISTAISQQNVSMPLGVLSTDRRAFTLQANGQLAKAADFESLVVANKNGLPVRLGELGRVSDSVDSEYSAAWYCTPQLRERAIVLGVLRQPGTNTVEVADAVMALLPEFKTQLPPSVSLHLLQDRSVAIRESARDVQYTLWLTLGLVVMVIFLFLRNLSATIIPSLVLPMSIIGTFTVMYFLNYSLDNLSLMALTLSIGFVVDDAIVMLENIVRHQDMGKSRLQAALDGSKEVGFTIVSMTISLSAVFIPVLFMPGVVGRFFREFSVTIGAAVLVSGFVSLTLTPMLCSRFLKESRRAHHGHFYRVSENMFQAIARFYGWTLLRALRHKVATVAFAFVILAGTIVLFVVMPKGFIPSEDRNMISINTEASRDTAFPAMKNYQIAVADLLRSDPNVASFMCEIGSGRSSVSNAGGMSVMLQPRRLRQQTADEIVVEWRKKLSEIPGLRVSLSNPPPINFGGKGGKAQYQLTLQCTDLNELYRGAAVLEEKMRTLSTVVDISSDAQQNNLQTLVDIDRDLASTVRVTPQQVEQSISDALSIKQVSTIMTPTDQYSVLMETMPQYQTDPSMLSAIHVRSATGQLVPLSSLAKVRETLGPLAVNHSGQFPSVTLSFNVKPGVALSQAIDEVFSTAVATIPGTIRASFSGTAQEYQKAASGMPILLVLAVVVIYIVLGILYESFYHPITILSALPFAGFGALLTLAIFNIELSMYAYVGIIMLVGLVKKNGIMMVDFAIEAQRTEGKNPHDAIHEACLVRFRPIMMTTMAALMAGLPIAMGYGAGGESRQPLGLAVVGGLLFSQTLTLYVTPVFYLYMEQLRNFMQRRRQARAAVLETA